MHRTGQDPYETTGPRSPQASAVDVEAVLAAAERFGWALVPLDERH